MGEVPFWSVFNFLATGFGEVASAAAGDFGLTILPGEVILLENSMDFLWRKEFCLWALKVIAKRPLVSHHHYKGKTE